MRQRLPDRSDDVVVIGGGIIGLAIAREAARSGIPVVLFEAGAPGAEASSAAAGLLSPRLEAAHPDPWLALGLLSRDLYPEFVAAVREESGIDPGLVQDGILVVARGAGEAALLEQQLAAQRALGLPARLLRGRAIRVLEPALAADVTAGALLPREGCVDNVLLVRGLALAAERAGVRIRSGVRAIRILLETGAVAAVETSAGVVPARAVVVAAGAWSSHIEAGGLPVVPTRPVRGQIACLRARPGTLRRPLHSENCYLVPRADGRILVGSTMEDVGYNRGTTPAALATLRAAAIDLVPALEWAPQEAGWAGLRPATEDGLPAIGPGGARGLFYATGHLRNGILLGPVTARIVVRLLRDEAPGIDLSPISPLRFAGAPSASRAPRPPGAHPAG